MSFPSLQAMQSGMPRDHFNEIKSLLQGESTDKERLELANALTRKPPKQFNQLMALAGDGTAEFKHALVHNADTLLALLAVLEEADAASAAQTLVTFLTSRNGVGKVKVTNAIAWVTTIKEAFTKELMLTNKSKGYMLLAGMRRKWDPAIYKRCIKDCSKLGGEGDATMANVAEWSYFFAFHWQGRLKEQDINLNTQRISVTYTAGPTDTMMFGANLTLMPWGDGVLVPITGTNLVVLGEDNQRMLHIKIFGKDGKPVADTDETKLPLTLAQSISTLKEKVAVASTKGFTQDERREMIKGAATIIVNAMKKEPVEDILLSRERLMHITDGHTFKHYNFDQDDLGNLDRSSSGIQTFWPVDYGWLEIKEALITALVNATEIKHFLARNVQYDQTYPMSVSNPFHLDIVISLWTKRSSGLPERVYQLWTAFGHQAISQPNMHRIPEKFLKCVYDLLAKEQKFASDKSAKK